MKCSIVWFCTVCICIFSLTFGAVKGQVVPRAWPCPDGEELFPCTCTSDADYRVSLDCSEAKDDAQLTAAFSAPFSFPESVDSLTIDQRECSDCYLRALTQDTFGSVSFVHVDIKGTSITTVEEETFGRSHNTLKSLRLSNNKISQFFFEAVGQFIELKSLYLNGNQFSKEILDIHSDSLAILNLSRNPGLVISSSFVQMCPLLREFHMSNVGLETVPMQVGPASGMFTGLEHIEVVDFTSNAITWLLTDTFVATQNTFLKIDVSNNNISVVHPQFVRGFANAAEGLLFTNNNIAELRQTTWEAVVADVATDKALNLAGNPLLCGCDIAWLLRDPAALTVVSDSTVCMGGAPPLNQVPVEVIDSYCP